MLSRRALQCPTSPLLSRHIHTPLASTSKLPSFEVSPNSFERSAYADPAYQRRYRDPFNHSAPRKERLATSGVHLNSRSRDQSTSSLASPQSSYPPFGTPRGRREEMERMWSAGEASPPVPIAKQDGTLKHAVCFVGSGSQYVSMGHVLKSYAPASRVWEEASEALAGFEAWRRSLKMEQMEGELGQLGQALEASFTRREKAMPLRDVVNDGPQAELTKSYNAQPAILITSVAFLRTLEDEFDTNVSKGAAAFCGHSSGELGICHASGMTSFSDSVRLARLHGLLTSHALALPSIHLSNLPSAPPARRGQMSAFIVNPGHSHADVLSVVASLSPPFLVEVASYNSTSQLVLSGSQEGILRAADILRAGGIANHAADLPVGAPFHCSFMKPAGEGMRVALESLRIGEPSAPMISGVDGGLILDRESLISNLVTQISTPVRWSTVLSTLRTSSIDRLLFFGPGKALANLARRDLSIIEDGGNSKTEVLSVATKEDLESVAELLHSEMRL